MSTISSPFKKPPRLILFDLDGTLIDSATSIFAAIEHAFSHFGLNIDFDRHQLVDVIGNGVGFILKKIKPELDQGDIDKFRAIAFSHYQQHAKTQTQLFSGVEMLINTLNRQKVLWGIITNKTRLLTEAVIARIPAYHSAVIVLCADLGASGLIIDFVYPYTKSNRLSSAA
ncbi:MAG: HAD family hydrolase [Francisellaceae bacterium]